MSADKPMEMRHVLGGCGLWVFTAMLAMALWILGRNWALIIVGLGVLGLALSFGTLHVVRFIDGGDIRPKEVRFSAVRMIERYPVPFFCCYLLDHSKLWDADGVMDPDHLFVFIPFLFVGLLFVALDGLLLPITFTIFALCYRDARRREVARVMHQAIKESNKPATLEQLCTSSGRWSSALPNLSNPPRCAHWSPKTP